MKPLYRSILVVALLIAAGVAVYTTVEFLVGLHGPHLSVGQYVGYLRYVILFFGLLYGLKNIRDTHWQGVLTFGRAVGVGTGISFLAGFFIALFELFYMQVINPGFMQDYLAFVVDEMTQAGETEVAIKMFLEQAKQYNSAAFNMLFYTGETTFFGVILSALLGALLKKGPSGKEASS